jgi:hypothetical protein
MVPMTRTRVHRDRSLYDALSSNLIRPRTSDVRFRFALALMVAGLLFSAGIASAQTTTDPTSGYTNPKTTESQPTTTEETQTTSPTTEAAEEDSAAPAVAAQTAPAPSNLAFTGGEPLLLIVLGLALTGGTALLLVRERRRGES